MSKLLDGLNPSQREAVTHETGPLLIIAGPGSGKTRTVVHSIAYAIENGVQPDRILAFSFTGKACEELRERVTRFVGKAEGQLVNISTFHSFCRKVLREDIEKLDKGYTRNFKELKPKEQMQVVSNQISEVRAQINITFVQHREFLKTKDILDFITRCKLQFIPPSVANEHVPHSEIPPEISRAYAEIYERYERVLEANSWIDYANQLRLANELLRDIPEVKKEWQEKFELIFVDEYQDTDRVQYSIIKTLAEKHQNLRVVGDDDQGIYGWRGADIQNILNFEKNYSTAKIIPLGQNYRSTQRIVDASRALAEFNPDRWEKELFTQNSAGKNIIHLHCKSAEEEVGTITSFIIGAIRCGWSSKDFAILCRLNSQVDEFKIAFNSLGIPSDGVSVMTIHGAKGLEFPNVFVAGVCKGLLPFGGNTENEERRLLYVAMTRAENWLCLSSYENDAGSNANGRSPFLDEIPRNLLEPTQLLSASDIPSKPIKSNGIESSTVVEEPLDSTTLSPIRPEIVLGIDPGKIDANNPNVGWAVTRKSSNGYTVIDCDTKTPKGTSDEKLKQIETQINALIASYSPDAIAVEKLEGATDRGLIGVAGCVALVRSIADQHGIERAFYSPQQVKYAATSNRNADKEQVQEGVKKRCNFSMVQNFNNIDDHSADAIAVSLCYLDSYLNSSHLQWKKRKQEHYDSGLVYLGNGQYGAAVAAFKEVINIDPIYTEAYYGVGRAYFAQGDLETAERTAKKALRLVENNCPDSQKLLDAIGHYRSGCNALNNKQFGEAITEFQESINLEPIFTEAHCGLSKAYLEIGNLETAKSEAEKALRLRDEYPPAQKLLDVITCSRHLEDEQYDAAIEAFTQTINKYPDFTAAHCGLGRAYLGKENLTAAEDSANKAQRLDPDYRPALELLESITQAYYDRGCDHLDNQRYNEAIAAFNEVVDRDSSFIDAHCQLGRVYLQQGDLDAARESARAARNLDRNHRSAHTFWESTRQAHIEHGRAALERGELDRAENIASEARGFYRNWFPAHVLLEDIRNQRDYKRGMAYLENEQFDKAIAAFKEVIDRDSNFIDAYCGLSRAYLGRRDLDAARKSANDALRIDENCRHARELLIDIQICSLQIDDPETRVDRERRDRGRRRSPRRRESNRNRRRDRGSRRSPRRRESNSGALQRLWRTIRNRLRHH